MWLLFVFTLYCMSTFKTVSKVLKGEFITDYNDLRNQVKTIKYLPIALIITTIVYSSLFLSFYVYSIGAIDSVMFYYMSIAQIIMCFWFGVQTILLVSKLLEGTEIKQINKFHKVGVAIYDVIYGVAFVYLGGLNNLF